MNIVEWFKKIIRGEKQRLLSENNMQKTDENSFKNKRRGLLSKLHREVENDINRKMKKEELLRNLKEDVIVDEPFPYNVHYDYNKFVSTIKSKDIESVLSEEDMTAICCMKGSICDGNNLLGLPKEIIKKSTYFPNSNKNVINEFLKENPNNIVILMNLMKQDAKRLLEQIGNDYTGIRPPTIQSLIPGSYSDVARLVDQYNKDKEASIE